MKRRAAIATVLLVLVGVGIAAFHYLQPDGTLAQFQGWVEADLIFVSPDEIGRVATLSVREGSAVEVGSPLFTLDDDLQRAAVAENEAAVTNAKQAYDRAQVLLKKAVGSQKDFDDAGAAPALGRGKAQFDEDETRTTAHVEPCRGDDPGGLFPGRRDGTAGPADRLDRAAG